MITEVDNYRGWVISFNTDQETFIAYSSVYDSEIKGKVSYAATKKYIDDFIKDNSEFKPFYAIGAIGSGNEKIKIIGIRKDNDFVFENDKGEKERLSSHNARQYVLYDEAIESKLTEHERLEDLYKAAYKKVKEFETDNNKLFVKLLDYRRQIV